MAKSEQVFLRIIRSRGPLVSLYEIADGFQEAEMSLPAVSMTLRRSPITAQYERGLYMLRGCEPSWEEVEEARGRQERISGKPQVRYGTDAKIRYQITVNQYGSLTGVLNAYALPDLGGEWKVFVGEEACGTANMDDMFIWGLKGSFERLSIEPGVRIEVTFDTEIRKVQVSVISDGRD